MVPEFEHDEAFVTIRHDGEGNPIAEPEELWVKAGTRVTWRSAATEDRPFTLDFDHRVPEPGPPRKRLEAKKEANGYRATIIATPGPASSASAQAGTREERFVYEVRSGDRSVDPAIIIQR
jgi:hypothetical protein